MGPQLPTPVRLGTRMSSSRQVEDIHLEPHASLTPRLWRLACVYLINAGIIPADIELEKARKIYEEQHIPRDTVSACSIWCEAPSTDGGFEPSVPDDPHLQRGNAVTAEE